MKQLISLLLISLISYTSTLAQDSKVYDIEETATNFLQKKYILAAVHPYYNYSTSYAYINRMRYENTFGEPLDDIKGTWRNFVPEVTMMSNPMENLDAFEYDIRSAMMMGIDGFKFEYRVYSAKAYKKNFAKVLSSYISVAEQKNIDFKFSIEVIMTRPLKYSSDNLFSDIKKDLNHLFQETKFSKKWMRTGNDKIIVFTKDPHHGIDEGINKKFLKEVRNNPAIIGQLGDKFDQLKEDLFAPVAFVYQISNIDNKISTPLILEHFAAVTTSRNTVRRKKNVQQLRALCKKHNREYIPTVFLEQQHTQLFSVEENKRLTENSEFAKSIPNKDTQFKASNHKQTSTFRRLMEDNITDDVHLINLSSWNLFDEGSHFAPEIHHSYGLGVLLNFYKNKWVGKTEQIDEEMIMTSYKNVLPGELNSNDNIKVNLLNRFYKKEALDSLEVLTLLKEEGSLYFNGKFIQNVPKGLHTTYVPLKQGNVEVQVKREGIQSLSFKSPKSVTGMNDRVDFTTYMLSNLDEKYSMMNHNLILNAEMSKMQNRFLLSQSKQELWKAAARERFSSDLEAIYEYGAIPEKFKTIKEKNYKKYKSSIKSLLDNFQYSVWLELEEKAKNNKGIEKLLMEEDETLKGYNMLDVLDFK
ncbi:glycoside hydrolase family 71/99 protein [Flammeovirga agarivorans]|uniref:Uncharacterized protein n=1 Tax=Flammeovirga agarivorans TaxID=2726742 RepID=A0A7X8XYB0_9BACT|nr:hypothetical protein [Flammeovirga agarivorans]NLR93963.1 hypothetical protein [Flammeovirga agarivorans]